MGGHRAVLGHHSEAEVSNSPYQRGFCSLSFQQTIVALPKLSSCSSRTLSQMIITNSRYVLQCIFWWRDSRYATPKQDALVQKLLWTEGIWIPEIPYLTKSRSWPKEPHCHKSICRSGSNLFWKTKIWHYTLTETVIKFSCPSILLRAHLSFLKFICSPVSGLGPLSFPY